MGTSLIFGIFTTIVVGGALGFISCELTGSISIGVLVGFLILFSPLFLYFITKCFFRSNK